MVHGLGFRVQYSRTLLEHLQNPTAGNYPLSRTLDSPTRRGGGGEGTQRTQYTLIKEYTFNYGGLTTVI